MSTECQWTHKNCLSTGDDIISHQNKLTLFYAKCTGLQLISVSAYSKTARDTTDGHFILMSFLRRHVSLISSTDGRHVRTMLWELLTDIFCISQHANKFSIFTVFSLLYFGTSERISSTFWCSHFNRKENCQENHMI